MKHHLVTLACTAAGAIAALAAGLLLGPSPAEQPLAAPQVVATEAKADRLPFTRRYPEAPHPVPAVPATLPVEAVSVPLAPEVAELLSPASGAASGAPEAATPQARHEHTICDRYGMHRVWYGRGPYQRWRCRR
jgi:hypothetical protein